jgi:hypothetical protein
MIVVEDGLSLLLVTQPDHARFAAELLSLWRASGLPEHPRRDRLLLAVREHDNGWQEADSAPRVDPTTGRPHDFLSFPLAPRLEIWERGTERFVADEPYVALLVAHHALALHHQEREEPGWQELLERLEQSREELEERAGVTGQQVAEDYRFLELADALSLAVCNRWPQPVARPGIHGVVTGGHLYLEPLPLAGATSFEIPVRSIPNRVYSGDADLGGELALARWKHLKIKVIKA